MTPLSPEVAAGRREPAPEVMCHAHHIRSPPPEVNHHHHDRLSPRHSLGSRLEAKYGSPYRQLKYSRSCIELGSVRRTSYPLQDEEDTEEGEGEGEVEVEGEGAVRSSRPGVSASGGRGVEQQEEEERSEAAFTALVHSSELPSAPFGDCNAGEVGGAAPDRTKGKVGSLAAALSGGVSGCLPGECTPSIDRIENEESQTNRNETKRAGLFIIGDTETEEQDNEDMLRKLPELGTETIHSIQIIVRIFDTCMYCTFPISYLVATYSHRPQNFCTTDLAFLFSNFF